MMFVRSLMCRGIHTCYKHMMYGVSVSTLTHMNRCQWIVSLRHLLVGHSTSPSQGSDLVLWTAPRWECKPCVVHQFDSDDARQVEPRLGRWHKVKISCKRGIWSIWDMGQDLGPCEDTVFSLFVFCSTHTHLDLAWLGLGLEAALGLWFHLGLKTRVARRLVLDVQPLISKSVGSKVVTVIAERCGKCFTKWNNMYILYSPSIYISKWIPAFWGGFKSPKWVCQKQLEFEPKWLLWQTSQWI